MTRIHMFPGQGSQSIGMGADLFDQFSDLTQQASDQLGYCIKTLCTEGPEDKLNNTQYTQPALYVVNALHYLSLDAQPNYVLGHSLGEYSALFAAGAFDFITGLKIVQKRGELMSQVYNGGMAAILGLSVDEVRTVLKEKQLDTIDLANINAPAQIVISGLASDIEAALPVFQDAGARRVVPLTVSGAFHSRHMKAAQDEFDQFLSGFSFNALTIPVIANCTARPYEDDQIQSNMVQQLTSSVRWVESMTYLLDLGEAECIEIGPGKVLAGLLKQIQRGRITKK